MGDDSTECQVRALREARGLSQAELARRAGASRQLVHIIERGKVVPSAVTALRLAQALGCSVEALFTEPERAASAMPSLRASRDCRGPVRIGKVGDRWIVVPVFATETAGFGEADGEVSQGGGKVRAWLPEAQLRENLLIAGCDPAIGIACDLWRRHHLPGSLCWRNLPSADAAAAVEAGEVHVAGVHFPRGEAGRAALAALSPDLLRVRFASWEQGWMLPPGNPRGFRSTEDLAGARFRLLNRAKGAGSRMLLDDLLARARIPARAVTGYRQAAVTHQQCAAAIAEGRADVAIGLRAIAEQRGLAFQPVEQVAFDLLVPRALADFPPVQRLLELLSRAAFQRQLNALPGYETRETGRVFA